MDGMNLLEVVGMAALATVNVSLWTFRVALAARGRKVAAGLAAGVEALLFALVFGAVVSALDQPVRVAAYAVGVAVGTFLGIIADERLAGGQSLAHVVVDGREACTQELLHELGWPVTATAGTGVRGPVTVLTVAVDDTALARLRADLDTVVPDGFVTVERLHDIRPTALPASMHAVGRSGRHTGQAGRRGHRPRDDDQ